MSKLVRLLRFAHAVEIGAYHAYEGHWRSLPTDSVPQNTIKAIQADELYHRTELARMLKSFGSGPSPALDGILWCIGKTISAGCYIMGYRMAMLGAKVMEIMGADIYKKLLIAARSENKSELLSELSRMEMNERDHERYIGICLRDQLRFVGKQL